MMMIDDRVWETGRRNVCVTSDESRITGESRGNVRGLYDVSTEPFQSGHHSIDQSKLFQQVSQGYSHFNLVGAGFKMSRAHLESFTSLPENAAKLDDA